VNASVTSASRSSGVAYQRASSPVESPTCSTSLQRAMSPRKQARTASEGAVTSSTKTTARSSCGRSVGRNAAPSQSANAGSKDRGGTTEETVDPGPGPLGSFSDRQGRWIDNDAQTTDGDRIGAGRRAHALETIGDVGQLLCFAPAAEQTVGLPAQSHHEGVLAAKR